MLIPCQVVLANPPRRESGPRGKKSPEYADLSSSQRVKFWPQMETGPFFIIFQLNPFKDLLKILVITTNIFTHYLLFFLLKIYPVTTTDRPSIGSWRHKITKDTPRPLDAPGLFEESGSGML